MRARGAIGGLLTLVAACSTPGTETLTVCRAEAALGTAGREVYEFRALHDGDGVFLTPGSQGSQHIWVSLRARGIDPEGALVRLRAVRPSDGAEVASLRLRTALREVGESPGWFRLSPQPLVIPDDVFCTVLHGPLILRAEASDAQGHCVGVSVAVNVTDLDPAADIAQRQGRAACCADPSSRCHARGLRDAGAGADATSDVLTGARVALTAWAALSPPMAPTATATAVWTGREMLVWGGTDDVQRGTGVGYDPGRQIWRTLSVDGALSPRSGHTAVWTGSEMILWGGAGRGHESDGAAYDPVTDRWRALSSVGRPGPRAYHRAVWTGTEMIVTGEYLQGSIGGRYRPDTDTWTTIPREGAPTGRELHSAVWTGTEMIVWGGVSSTFILGDGARWDPVTGGWRRLTTVDAPVGRVAHATVWTGSEMLIWGGWNGTDALADGAAYDPVRDRWREISSVGAPSARTGAPAVWTGSEMVVWGGFQGSVGLSDGGRYDPARDRWEPLPQAGAPSPRWDHTAVWTDSEVLIWGGFSPGNTVTPAAAALGPR